MVQAPHVAVGQEEQDRARDQAEISKDPFPGDSFFQEVLPDGD